MRFVSDHGPDGELDKRVEGLRDTGRAIGIDQVKSGAEAVAVLRAARFSVSPYFEEGYGLPIALSLALGTPVLSGFHGGTRDTRAVPGALLVDSGDDEAIVDGMRILLTDDAALRALVDGVKLRPRRSWDDFAVRAVGPLGPPRPGGIVGGLITLIGRLGWPKATGESAPSRRSSPRRTS